MNYIITETKTINITAEVEAPNATAAMLKYKKDSPAYSVDYSEQSNVEVDVKSDFLGTLPPEEEEE